MLKTVCFLIFWFGCSSFCDAQLFRRSRWSGLVSTGNRDTMSQNGHWGFPGRIVDHLSGFHGQDISGLTREQLLDLHDAIHEGRAVPSRRLKQTSQPAKPKQSWAPSV